MLPPGPPAEQHAAELFTFDDVQRWLAFFLAVWVAGVVANAASLPSLVGEVLCGALLGPPLADFVPKQEALALLGQLGLVMLVIESGLETDVGLLRSAGPRAVAIAVVGSIALTLPIALGLAVGVGCPVLEALAVGASLSPTSMGAAVVIFKQARVLNTPTAQVVVAAAVLDDIIGLILLSELQALKQPSASAFIIPVVSAVCFLVGIGAAALYAVPPLLTRVLLPRIPTAHVANGVLLLLFVTSMGLGEALNAGRASYLLGCFLAGLAFSCLSSMQGVWHMQVKRLQTWLLRLFFAATVGFLIPLTSWGTPQVWAHAFLFTIASLGKVATGLLARPFSLPSFLTIGAAMGARGEFAFLVANTAFGNGTMSEETHAAVMLAIVLSLIAAPAALRAVLAWQARVAERALVAASSQPRSVVFYKLSLASAAHWGLVPGLLKLLGDVGVTVLECRVDSRSDGHAVKQVILEAYLKDTQLVDDDPESPNAPGLADRLAFLRSRLFTLLSDGDEVDATSEVTMDVRPAGFTMLHGVRLRRWLPGRSPAEWATWGAVGNEAQAQQVMRAEIAERSVARGAGLRPGFSSFMLPASSDAFVADCVIADAAAAAEARREAAHGASAGLVGLVRREPVDVDLLLPAALSRRRSFMNASDADVTAALAVFREQMGPPATHDG